MFFPDNNNTFFITEEELTSLTFRKVVENWGYNIEFFEEGFDDDNINFDLPMIDFYNHHLI
jgi:hypothetical protein